MYFKIEYFRVLHYLYFYLAALGIILAIPAWNEAQGKSIVLAITALVNLYFSYRFESNVRQLLVESGLYRVLSHILIICMAAAYYFISAGHSPFTALRESTLIISTYISILTTLIVVLIKLNIAGKAMNFIGISRAQIGLKKAVFVISKSPSTFKDVLSVADPGILKSYRTGTSEKIDDLLRDINDTGIHDKLLWDIRFLLIYLYEEEIHRVNDASRKEKISRTISKLKKLL